MYPLTLRLLLALVALTLCAPAAAVTYVVNSLADTGDNDDGNGVCATGSIIIIGGSPTAQCTLRAALEEADARRGPDAIHFHPNLSTTGGFARFTPASPYPEVTDLLTIDGTTAPGYATANPNATPVVQIDGSNAGVANGLELTLGGSSSTILALALFGFGADGIQLVNADSVAIQGCHLGVENGIFFPGNGAHGIDLRAEADGNVIGQSCGISLGCLGRGNVISGNGANGIRISNGDGNRIAGNYIGTNVTGTSTGGTVNVTGNEFWGVSIERGGDNDIGDLGTVFVLPPGSPFQVAAGNVISGNGFGSGPDLAGGLYIGAGSTSATAPPALCDELGGGDPLACGGNRVRANRIGTDVAGTIALGNANSGVLFRASNENVIGGSGLAANVISGNRGCGIELSRIPTFSPMLIRPIGTQIIGNTVGLDVGQNTPLPNNTCCGDAAIETWEGLETLADSNIVSGNERSGLGINGIAINNVVGTNGSFEDLGNGGIGIYGRPPALPDPPGGLVAGAIDGELPPFFQGVVGLPSQGNVVGFNELEGIIGTVVQGNWVGTNEAGEDMGNGRFGIVTRGSGLVGGALPGEANIVGFNRHGGVAMTPQYADTVIEANLIGVLPSGAPVGNFGPGVALDRNDRNVIGAAPDAPASEVASRGNWIAHNTGPGIWVAGGTFEYLGHSNTARGNRLHGNGGLSIELSLGPNANDAGDADEGPNLRQNTPELDPNLTEWNETTGDLTITYRVPSLPIHSRYPITVDFYLNDGSAGPAAVYVGSDSYELASAELYKTIALTPPAGVTVAGQLVATATDQQGIQAGNLVGGNTSELSAPVMVPEPPALLGLLASSGLLALLSRRRGRSR